MADSLVEQAVFEWLPLADADTLQGLCDEYKIEVAKEKIGRKDLLLKLVRRYLTSERLESNPDESKAVFDKLYAELGERFGKKTVKKDVNATFSSDIQDFEGESANLTFHRLRDFKINGTIGNVGQKETLTYTSLSIQMKQGKNSGYSSKEVCAAVIRAIKPGNSLRDYLESKSNITEAALIQILRSHFKEKDSISVFHELSNCVQLVGESEHEFCLRAMSLREKVSRLSEEEECPFDQNLLKNVFFMLFLLV